MRVFAVMASLLTLGACTTLPDPSGVHISPRMTAIADGTAIKYIEYMPAHVTADMPVLVFLHGSGEAGNNPFRVMGPGPWDYAQSHADFPFVILAPQQPRDEEWDPARLDVWLDHALKNLPADRHRIYLTGLSLGGGGAWDWAMTRPDRFAAIAPVSGYSNLKQPCKLTGNHIWAFHGEKDDVVPLSDEQPIVDAAKACGIDVKYTLYPGGNHNAWDETYANPALYDWLLDHKN